MNTSNTNMAAIVRAEMPIAEIKFLHGLFDSFITNTAKYDILRLCLGISRTRCWKICVDMINPLTPNDLQRRRAMSPLKITIPSNNMREKPTNTPIIHSFN
jgi:hypothetical protein